MCWIAAEVFDGWDDARTQLVRNYVLAGLDEGAIARFLVHAYMRFGERAARVVRAHRLARMLATYVFTEFFGRRGSGPMAKTYGASASSSLVFALSTVGSRNSSERW